MPYFYVKTMLCAALLALQMSPAQAGDTPHTMKDDSASTGSRLRPNIAWSSLPFGKSYGQLSEEQKQLVRAQYESMGPDDEPPYPAKGIANIFRDLREAASILQSEGELFVGVLIGPDGKGVSVNVYKTPHPDLAAFAAATLMKTAFKPALCQGKPCVQEYPLQIKFVPPQ